MPCSETALEELMCRDLGDFLEQGTVAKLADDPFCGVQTPQELLSIWERLLRTLQKFGTVRYQDSHCPLDQSPCWVGSGVRDQYTIAFIA